MRRLALMKRKQAYLGITVFMLIVSFCFVPTVISENSSNSPDNPVTISQEGTTSPSNMSITLVKPAENTILNTTANVSFTFYPAINGSAQLTEASLWINGSRISYNQTVIVPWQNNTIYHQITKNGTYMWSIKLENSENAIIQSEERTLKVELAEELAVELVAPKNDTTITNSFNVSFVFIPKINSSDYQLTGASLYIDNIRVEDNQTAIVPDKENVIYYVFSGNGSHRWNIRLHSSSGNAIFSPASYNFTLAVAPASPTPTPTNRPTNTPTAPPTTLPTSTPTTPSPSPGGSETELDLGTLIAVAVIVFSVVLIVTIFLLRRRAR